MHYAVVIEKTNGSYAAYVPDLPGCIATGATPADIKREIHAATLFHLDGLRADGQTAPESTSECEYVDA
jgi:predicted RNase H-like HicB family nuclease